MMKHSSEALKRADRALCGAIVLTASFAAGIILGHNAPATAQVPPAAAITHVVTQITRQAAPGADAQQSAKSTNVKETAGAMAMAVSYVPSAEGFAGALYTVAAMPSAAGLAMIKVLEDQRCLAEAMYYEARGEGRAGQEAIAEVVFHRMHAGGYPRSICGVVYQGANRSRGCQFSFACDGELQQPKSSAAWFRARTLAAKIMAGIVRLGDITGDAISFHAADIQPEWTDRLEKTIQIGNHVFYRAAARTKPS